MFWSESGEKSADQNSPKTALNKYVAEFWCERRQEMDFYHWRKSYYGLWTHIWVKNVLMLDLFDLLSSPDVNWWTGVVWIIVMFLSAVWTLILTAPIHIHWSIAETLMLRHISTNLMKKQTHPNLGWPESSLSLMWCILKTLMLYLFLFKCGNETRLKGF